MVRMRAIEVVKYGSFREYYALAEKMIEHTKKQGWAIPKLLTPVAGRNNEVIWEIEYDSIADIEPAMQKMYADREYMDMIRGQASLVIEGTSTSELLET